MTGPSTVLFMLAAVFGVIGLWVFFALRKAIAARRPVASTFRLLWLLLLDGLAIACVLLAVSLTGYVRLTSEVPVLELAFSRIADQEYRVEVKRPDGQVDEVLLRGDDWRVDARVVKWTPWAVLAGLDPVYRLDRIGGRYHDPEQERRAERSVHVLGSDSTADMWQLARQYPRWLPFVDTEYGSSAYLPMRDGEHVRLTLSPLGGLVARKVTAPTGGSGD